MTDYGTLRLACTGATYTMCEPVRISYDGWTSEKSYRQASVTFTGHSGVLRGIAADGYHNVEFFDLKR